MRRVGSRFSSLSLKLDERSLGNLERGNGKWELLDGEADT